MVQDAIREQLRLPMTVESYNEIRETWKRHSIAEDARDIAGLMSTLTTDCVYELLQTGHRWEGHAGATRFYLELLGGFPDVVFRLTDIVIGPQGVCEMADVTGTHLGPWLGGAPTGQAGAVEGRDLLPVGSRGTPVSRREGVVAQRRRGDARHPHRQSVGHGRALDQEVRSEAEHDAVEGVRQQAVFPDQFDEERNGKVSGDPGDNGAGEQVPPESTFVDHVRATRCRQRRRWPGCRGGT